MSRWLALQLLATSLLAIFIGPVLAEQIQSQLQPKTKQGYTAVYFENSLRLDNSIQVGSYPTIVISNGEDYSQTYNWDVRIQGQVMYSRSIVIKGHQRYHTQISAPVPGLLEVRFQKRNLILKAQVR